MTHKQLILQYLRSTYEDVSAENIGEALDIPVANVRGALHRLLIEGTVKMHKDRRGCAYWQAKRSELNTPFV